MAPDALRMLARQLRVDPNPDAIEDAACALEAVAIERERQARGPESCSRGDSAPGGPPGHAAGPARMLTRLADAL